MSRFVLPDVLVLAAGGILGEAWMSGVLAGIEDGADVDFRDVEDFVGTSAGSIVAARLAAGRRPRRPRRRRAARTRGFARMRRRSRGDGASGRCARRGRARAAAASRRVATTPFVPPRSRSGAPAGARARGLVLSRLPDRGLELDAAARRDRRAARALRRAPARVHGRPRDGPARRVRPPGRADAPRSPTRSPRRARSRGSSGPVEIGGREYVDGGAWSLTNLDVAPAGRDSEVLCLHPSASLGLALTSLYGFARAAVGAAAELEVLALRARGARVRLARARRRTRPRGWARTSWTPRPARAVLSRGVPRRALEIARG